MEEHSIVPLLPQLLNVRRAAPLHVPHHACEPEIKLLIFGAGIEGFKKPRLKVLNPENACIYVLSDSQQPCSSLLVDLGTSSVHFGRIGPRKVEPDGRLRPGQCARDSRIRKEVVGAPLEKVWMLVQHLHHSSSRNLFLGPCLLFCDSKRAKSPRRTISYRSRNIHIQSNGTKALSTKARSPSFQRLHSLEVPRRVESDYHGNITTLDA